MSDDGFCPDGSSQCSLGLLTFQETSHVFRKHSTGTLHLPFLSSCSFELYERSVNFFEKC